MYVTATSPRFSRGRSTPATRAMCPLRSSFERRLCRRNPSLGEVWEGGRSPPPRVYPCRALCRGFLQMILVAACRLTILQCSRRTLTVDRTFLASLSPLPHNPYFNRLGI